VDLEASIAAVKEALLADERVCAALLFGSAAKGVARAASDLDVALLARSAQAADSLDADYLDLLGRLVRVAERDVHLVLLDRADPVLARQAFAGARVLFDRDPSRTANALERVLLQYFDGEYHRRMRAEALDRGRRTRHG